jgi:hypothetical protein
MGSVDVTMSLPSEVYEAVEKSAGIESRPVPDYLVDLVRTNVRSEEDKLAIEGYQALAEETLVFAASAMATVRETWPGYGVGTSPPRQDASNHRSLARHTCRTEILAAIPALVARNGSEEFTMQEVVDELRRRGSRYAEATIRTHVGSRMCANARQNHGTVFSDVERLDHGVYRLMPHANDRAGAL